MTAVCKHTWQGCFHAGMAKLFSLLFLYWKARTRRQKIHILFPNGLGWKNCAKSYRIRPTTVRGSGLVCKDMPIRKPQNGNPHVCPRLTPRVLSSVLLDSSSCLFRVFQAEVCHGSSADKMNELYVKKPTPKAAAPPMEELCRARCRLFYVES